MEANSQICPVCTLYLRPGMTLKSHLASHPKQKVIEALCRLSTAEVDPDPEPEKQLAPTSTNLIQPGPSQQWSPAGLQPAPIPGNHSFIYQQWSSSAPPSNMVNVGHIGQQYVTIPTVLPPQMMCPPYVYQQQQVIMSSGAQLPPMPPLTRMLPIEPSVIEPQAQIIEEIDDELDKIQQPDLVLIENSLDGLNVNVQSQEAEGDEIKEDEIEINEEEVMKSPKPLELNTTFEEGERELGSPGSNASSDFIRVRRDLNKSCQTQSDDEDNYESGKSEVDDGNYVTLTANQNEGNVSTAPQAVESQNLMDMDGMNLILNADFMQNQIISQVEDFDYNCKYERPAVIMNIGEYNDGRDESVSVDSTNIRADEHMPPRGELSGQESNASDIAWNRIQYAGSSATSYDLLARESWDGSDASDNDNEMPPLQSRVPQEYDINDTPTVSGFSEPPIQYKCSTCGDNFNCPKERKEHQAEQHAKPNVVGSRLVGAKKVKKLVIKPKKIDVKTENNFDNVFTNKLKLESAEAESNLLMETPPVIIDVQKMEEQLIINNPTVCTVCEMVLADGKMLAAHQLEVHNISTEQKYKCAMCGEAFPNEPKFTEHLAVHPLECRLCGKYFYKRQNLQLHMKRHLGIKPFKCIVCEKSFLTKQKLEEHKNVHTGDTPIQCNMCEESFRRHSNLVQHKNRHHFNIKKKIKDYICFCGEVFHSKKKLAWHREIHENKPKACKQCNEKFVHAASLTRHMRRAHNERFVPEPDRFNENVECPICKGVYLKSSLDIHIKNHSGEKPYSCSICNKDFTTKWNLKLHKWTHASRTSKPFKCDQCNGAFIRETDYVAHMNSHKSIKPYTCNYCGAQFIRKYNCQRHVREHEKNKTFSCQVCGKLFHRSYYLKDHMRIHSGVRPYSCHICGKTSTTKSNHNKHVRIHHAREPVSTEN